MLGSCVVFLVHGTILQQWTSLLKNSASIEKRKLACDCWRIVPLTVEQSCQWLLLNYAIDWKNRASHCCAIVPVTVEELCQWLLKNRASNCWRIMLATAEQSFQQLLHITLKCWTIVPVTVEKLCLQLWKNCASDCWRLYASDCWKNCVSNCWWIVPTAIEQSCQLFLSLFLTYFGKILTSFSFKYLNYYWLFQFRIVTE